MPRLFFIILLLSVIGIVSSGLLLSPLQKEKLEKPLKIYSFQSLQKKQFLGSHIELGKVLKESTDFTSVLFYFNVSDVIDTTKKRKVSGLITLPKTPGIYPVIVMFRGYVDKESYTTGEGTRHGAEVFAKNGYITIAPDFLGYGESDFPSINSMEERFQTYTTSLTLLASIKNLDEAFNHQCYAEFTRLAESKRVSASPEDKILNPSFIQDYGRARQVQDDNLCNIKVDATKIGIWGHSNGGHIALSLLEITGGKYPTVLWAPVSKPFPYSILYFTDEFDDHGKALRKLVADFEKDYDVENYSLTNYLDLIQAPLQIHQGSEDEAVPKRWTDDLVLKLQDKKKQVTYYTYSGDDHNFSKGSWSQVVMRDLFFYDSILKN